MYPTALSAPEPRQEVREGANIGLSFRHLFASAQPCKNAHPSLVTASLSVFHNNLSFMSFRSNMALLLFAGADTGQVPTSHWKLNSVRKQRRSRLQKRGFELWKRKSGCVKRYNSAEVSTGVGATYKSCLLIGLLLILNMQPSR